MRLRAVLFLHPIVALLLPAMLPAEALIIAGGGWVGQWDTAIEVANVSAEPVEVTISIGGLPVGVPCPPACTAAHVVIPGRGSKRVLASEFIGGFYPGAQLIRVEMPFSDGRLPLPVVHARVFRRSDPALSAELPVDGESSLAALGTAPLVFPGAARNVGIYSNLILQLVGTEHGTAVAEVLVEAFGSGGEALGSARHLIAGRTTSRAFTLVDVLGSLGLSTAEGVQIRVTKLSGSGVPWGVLTTVVGNDSLEVAVGAHP